MRPIAVHTSIVFCGILIEPELTAGIAFLFRLAGYTKATPELHAAVQGAGHATENQVTVWLKNRLSRCKRPPPKVFGFCISFSMLCSLDMLLHPIPAHEYGASLIIQQKVFEASDNTAMVVTWVWDCSFAAGEASGVAKG